jgi:hypothetical protein
MSMHALSPLHDTSVPNNFSFPRECYSSKFLSTVLEPAVTYAILYLAPHGHIPIVNLRAEAGLDTEYTHPGEPPRGEYSTRAGALT